MTLKFISHEKISVQDLIENKNYQECGGLCSFEGLVRNHHKGKQVTHLIYEAYVPMAEREIARLQDEIQQEWPQCHVAVKHRIGEMKIGEVAVAIAVWAPHRHEAFVACEAFIDRIKQSVPIWKHEFYTDGTNDWVACSHHSRHGEESKCRKEKIFRE